MIDDDYQAWEIYPKYRWIFNKLELALTLGYQAGPACVPLPSLQNQFKAIIRPIYNLYGMGIGAKVYTFIPEIDNDFIIHHGSIPPGYFWCEYFEGTHYSIDYKNTNAPKGSAFMWESFNTMIGEHSEQNLTKFTKWTHVECPKIELPNFLYNLTDVNFLNVEFIDNKIIEIHLRTGNDIFHNKILGTVAIPIWKNEVYKVHELRKDGYEFKTNLYPESFKYDADGHLNDIRIGYMIK